jgi:hypothetical protein
MRTHPLPSHDGAPLLEQVLAAVSAYDPEGLFWWRNMPLDEYEIEARELTNLIGDGCLVTPDVVTEVWEKWFGPGSGFVTDAKPGEIEGLAADLDAIRLRHRPAG